MQRQRRSMPHTSLRSRRPAPKITRCLHPRRTIHTQRSLPQSTLKHSQLTHISHLQHQFTYTNQLRSIQIISSAASEVSSPAGATTAKPKRPRRSPLTITDTAAQRVQFLCDSQDPPAKGIRLGVRTRGCNGLSYTMNFADAATHKLDETVLVPGTDINIFIDNKALLYVIGTTMDWVETDVNAEFTFNNPNSKGSCGCGESFTV